MILISGSPIPPSLAKSFQDGTLDLVNSREYFWKLQFWNSRILKQPPLTSYLWISFSGPHFFFDRNQKLYN